MKSPRHIAIEGCIGAGKTTLAKELSVRLERTALLEASSLNPFLEKFYCDPPRYALETELAFLLIHYHQLMQVSETDCVVSDFTYAKNLAFGHLNLVGRDLVSFTLLFEELNGRLPAPDLVLFLDVPVDECMARIARRDIKAENSIDEGYLLRLRQSLLRKVDGLGNKVQILELAATETAADVVFRALRCVTETSTRP